MRKDEITKGIRIAREGKRHRDWGTPIPVPLPWGTPMFQSLGAGEESAKEAEKGQLVR